MLPTINAVAYELLRYLIDHCVSILINRVPVFPVKEFEFGKAFRCVGRALQLAHDNITHIVFFEKLTSRLSIPAVIEIANSIHTVFNPERLKDTLLTLMPVPAHHTR